jgi:hypothetical protein
MRKRMMHNRHVSSREEVMPEGQLIWERKRRGEREEI